MLQQQVRDDWSSEATRNILVDNFICKKSEKVLSY